LKPLFCNCFRAFRKSAFHSRPQFLRDIQPPFTISSRKLHGMPLTLKAHANSRCIEAYMKNRSAFLPKAALLPNKVSRLSKACALSLIGPLVMAGCGGTGVLTLPTTPGPAVATVTPQTAIKHVVVIFGENISFDHYFGTYPNAANTDGTSFTAAAGTPIPANYTSTPSLLTANPNENGANSAAAGAFNSTSSPTGTSIPANPFRLSPSQAGTGDQDHNYGPEQLAFDNGKMDLFPFSIGVADAATLVTETVAPGIANTTALTMGYYDGNTVTAMWNYAQHYALNDHSFGTTFGASTQGAINLVSGQTNGAVVPAGSTGGGGTVDDGQGGLTLVGDEDPANDVCSGTNVVQMTGKNIGDLLNTANISWGFFEGGFNLQTTNTNHTTGCTAGEGPTSRSSAAVNIPGNPVKADYIPHHQPFQYYTSTANPTHIPAASPAAVGTETGASTANHQYDTSDFNAALAAGNLPAVSFLKAPGFQDGHAGYSDPLDEQTFVVTEVNAIEKSSFWSSTAIILAYDDSDGWYDHVSNFVNGSTTKMDEPGFCASAPVLGGVNTTSPVQGRCGYGPRLPLMVISPWAKKNFIDTTVTDQSSITRFIEDIFLGSTRIGGGSSDTNAGSIMGMFNFTTTGGALPNPNVVQLNATTGAVTSGN
jgi:phospholipase C